MTSNEAECLINVPPVKYYDSLVNPGRIWSADDQCKLVYGNNATFCKVSNIPNETENLINFLCIYFIICKSENLNFLTNDNIKVSIE